ncbi:hypothetical protein E2562_027015 [Oryza meyeriana var. granulata]|uniref:DUF834 domain-containing protein n=1 Tax=Oryza meyeriana var. granulata TaxID=110450 RepID=A0A6G1C935_9ORYZ|nr:hypothetical protein E2562_027015 [Oryza meyeriana var. granulata]
MTGNVEKLGVESMAALAVPGRQRSEDGADGEGRHDAGSSRGWAGGEVVEGGEPGRATEEGEGPRSRSATGRERRGRRRGPRWRIGGGALSTVERSRSGSGLTDRRATWSFDRRQAEEGHEAARSRLPSNNVKVGGGGSGPVLHAA